MVINQSRIKRKSGTTRFVACVVGITTVTGCSFFSSKDDTKAPVPTIKASSEAALFKNVAAQVGLNFKHDLGDEGKFFIVENTAPGCAFIDYNNDGFLDIFLVQSGPSGPATSVSKRPTCALYLNKGDGNFEDVTLNSGLDKDFGYGQGVAVGDYDNDGYDDLFLTCYGGNRLLRNQKGTGKFQDVTKAMGLDKIYGTGYATSAAFGDYDNDGRLDLYVCYYMKWTHALNKECRDDITNEIDYCFPGFYDPTPHQLLHNTGQKFVDVSQKSGISSKSAHGLAVSFFDYNQDGHQDIFVANDLTPNMLWRNKGNGTFTDASVEAGVAYGEEGSVMAAMGIAIADYDHSGQESFYVSNFAKRPNILFRNLGDGVFEDVTQQVNLGSSHHDFLTFGCEFFDYDADGWSDLITNNGHVQTSADHRADDIPYQQRKQLLHNEKGVKFEEIADKELLGELTEPTVGRGLATGDYNNDGRVDIMAVSQNGPVQLFKNQVQNDNHWISFQTIGTKSNRNGIHARLVIKAGAMRQVATVRGGSSYLSSSDRRVYFGLGSVKKIDEVLVTWPSGTRETLKNLEVDTFYTLTEGKGVSARRAFSKETGDLQNTATSAER
jgi:hypothetical protein